MDWKRYRYNDRDKKSLAKQRYREYLKLRGICTSCCCRPARDNPPRVHCEVCARAKAEARNERVSRGFCADCPNSRDGASIRWCAKCVQERRAQKERAKAEGRPWAVNRYDSKRRHGR